MNSRFSGNLVWVNQSEYRVLEERIGMYLLNDMDMNRVNMDEEEDNDDGRLNWNFNGISDCGHACKNTCTQAQTNNQTDNVQSHLTE